jgi:ElaA protein
MLKIITKSFSDLSINELYDILQLRAEVFIVEQNCVYQDIDSKDKKALHIIGLKKDKIIAYTRIFKSGDYFSEASIGRVVVKQQERKYSYGHQILKASIKAIETNFKTTVIKISAQTYLKKFYETHGFKQVSEEYLEDDIPHIAMIKD